VNTAPVLRIATTAAARVLSFVTSAASGARGTGICRAVFPHETCARGEELNPRPAADYDNGSGP